MLKLNIQAWPPLGQATRTSDKGDIDLTAVLEVPTLDADLDWDVSLWYSKDGNEWGELSLEALDQDSGLRPQALDQPDISTTRLYFGRSIHINRSLRFTLRYRHSKESEWIWARDQLDLEDGIAIVPASEPPSDKLEDFIEDLDPEWQVSSCLCQTPRTQLWMVETSVPRPRLNRGESDGDVPSYKDVAFGLPKNAFLRWFALVRHSTAWLAPRHGKEEFGVDKDAVLCVFLLDNGRYLVLLGVGGVGDVLTVLQSTADGHISAHARSDSSGQFDDKAKVLVAEGSDLGCVIAAVVYKMRELFQHSRRVTMDYQAEETPLYGNSRFHPEWYENWYDGLGYCTWNALGQDLSEIKVLEAVKSLAENGISITNLILDDNWQSLDRSGPSQFSHGWEDFEADPKAFPSGLKSLVSKIRDKHPNIQHVAVWHALLGYWGGISSKGELAKKYKTISLQRKDAQLGLDDEMTVIAEEDVEQFYKDFYAFLSDCGIDSVKADVQAMVDTWTSTSARRGLLYTYLDSWSLAALKYFSMRAISCMSLFPHGMFYTQNNLIRPSFPVRTSDDYFPHEPDSHAWHVWTNAHNCLMMQDLNIVPDWDMFQTKHEWGGYHAAARCLSGGPIYITDEPGKHDMGLIRRITGKTPRGKTVTFRPSVIGKAVDPFVGFHDNSLLKIGSYHGASETGTSILGFFNVSKRSVTELVPLSSFPGILEEQEYVARAYSTGRVSSVVSQFTQSTVFTVGLEPRGWDILSLYPLTSLPGVTSKVVKIATLGLLDKFTGCAAMTSKSIESQDNGRVMIDTRLKAFGTLGVYISNLPHLSIDGDFMITIQGRPIPRDVVSISSASDFVLEIDVEKAWQEMGLDSGWSNEVQVKVNVAA